MMHAVSPRAMMLAALVAMATAAGPSSVAAQRAETRNFVLSYEPGSPTRNGYADAQLEMRYWFQACPQVHLVVQSSQTVRMLVGAHRYWYNGQLVQVPRTIAPPDPNSPSVRGTIRGNGIIRDITNNFVSPSASCFNSGVQVGEASAFWKPGTTDEEKVRILNQFGFDYQQTLGPLTNAAVENHFREQFAAARRDSAQKAQVVRADSLRRAREKALADRASQARADSTARATERAGSGSAGSTGSTTSGSTGRASTGTSSGNSTAATREADAARAQAERDARAREEAARDAEHARVTEANRREKAIQDSIAVEQLAQSTAQAAMAVGQLLGMVFEGLEGTGLMLGGSYSSPYFEGDKGLIGITVSGYMDGFVLPFLELHYVMEGEDYGTEKTLMAATIGSVIPKTGFTLPKGIPLLGGQYKAHAGLVYLTTTESVRQFNYIERNRYLAMFGLTHFGGESNLVTRLDMTIYGGTPRWGFALGKAF